MRDVNYYRSIEGELLSILSELGPEWTAEDKTAVQEEIGYAEYGLAIEVLAGSAVNLGRPLSPDLRKRIGVLADRAGLQDSALIASLRKRQAA